MSARSFTDEDAAAIRSVALNNDWNPDDEVLRLLDAWQRCGLTDDERAAVEMAGRLWNLLCRIVGNGETRSADLNELVAHIHAVQHAVMANAAARRHPFEMRALGEEVP